jgi:hypothetical protein
VLGVAMLAGLLAAMFAAAPVLAALINY